MAAKAEPQRMCIVCRKQGNKSEFIRIVKTPDGNILDDDAKKCSGRGAYICADVRCVEQAKKKRALDRVFKTRVDDEVYDRLISRLQDRDD